jgi:hypothetical protein
MIYSAIHVRDCGGSACQACGGGGGGVGGGVEMQLFVDVQDLAGLWGRGGGAGGNT